MGNNKPRVSIGMPVFNGENYLEESLDSILAQTYSDFELIISDNASTDNTQEICLKYAANDSRIRYIRHKVNVGAAKNHNDVFELSSGEYFKWAAHDDLCAPEFLEKCVKVLDQDPSIILCYSRTKEIDKRGTVLREYTAKPNLSLLEPSERFFECVCVPHSQVAVFGLIRMISLKKTRLIGSYSSSDRVLLGELTLLGRFYEIPEYLFLKRDHQKQHWRVYATRQSRVAWYDPARAEKMKITFPHWRLLLEHYISIKRAPLNLQERARCYIYLAWWIRQHWFFLAANLILREPKKRNLQPLSISMDNKECYNN
jgi:glycosyltransferase involved in cell wall biosynthesis